MLIIFVDHTDCFNLPKALAANAILLDTSSDESGTELPKTVNLLTVSTFTTLVAISDMWIERNAHIAPLIFIPPFLQVFSSCFADIRSLST